MARCDCIKLPVAIYVGKLNAGRPLSPPGRSSLRLERCRLQLQWRIRRHLAQRPAKLEIVIVVSELNSDLSSRAAE